MLRRAFNPVRSVAVHPGGSFGVMSVGQRRNAAHYVPSQMPIVKKKWKTIDVIKVTTETMKNVAAGKLPGVERFLKMARPFAGITAPFFDVGQAPPPEQLNNILHIGITTERGLCGFVGSNIGREVLNNVMGGKKKKDEKSKKNNMVAVYGKKGVNKLAGLVPGTLPRLEGAYGNTKMSNAHFNFICDTCDNLLKVDFDMVKIYYNRYKSTTQFDLAVKTMYRLDMAEAVAKVQFPAYEIEADEAMVMQNLYDWKFACEIYHATAEQRASEEGSRLQSMDGAVQACKEKSAEYEKIYQKLRQTKITSELTVLAAGVKTLQAAKKRSG